MTESGEQTEPSRRILTPFEFLAREADKTARHGREMEEREKRLSFGKSVWLSNLGPQPLSLSFPHRLTSLLHPATHLLLAALNNRRREWGKLLVHPESGARRGELHKCGDSPALGC